MLNKKDMRDGGKDKLNAIFLQYFQTRGNKNSWSPVDNYRRTLQNDSTHFKAGANQQNILICLLNSVF